MRSTTILAVISISLLALLLSGNAIPKDSPRVESVAQSAQSLRSAPEMKIVPQAIGTKGIEATTPRRAPTETIATIVQYDFDDGIGGPDTHGWTVIDKFAQKGTFFHVDDFVGLTGYAPLSGSKSLWCGVRPATEWCQWTSLP